MVAFREELAREGEPRHTPLGDRVLGSYCVAMSGLLNEETGDPHIRNLYRDIIRVRDESKKTSPPSGLVRLSITAAQKQLLAGNGLPIGVRYPYDYVENDELWTESLDMLYGAEEKFGHSELTFDQVAWNLQSNVSERYKGFKLPLVMFRERFGEVSRVLDVGASRNHGLKRMTQQSRSMRFNMTRVMEVQHGDEPTDKTDAYSSRKIRNALAAKIPLRGVGVEPFPVLINKEGQEDEGHRRWIESCSFYPSELMNRQRLNMYRKLDSMQIPGIEMRQGNFAVPYLHERFPELPDEPFDMVTFSTVLYQMRDKHSFLRAMLENALRYVKDDGMIIVQDFVKLNQDFPNDLEFPDNWYDEPYGYRTLIYDMTDQKRGFQEFVRWKNGRCMKMIWGDSPLAEKARVRI